MRALPGVAALLALALAAPATAQVPQRVQLHVVATAYNSTHSQTDGDPHIGAWGDRLDQVQGTRVIAVSPDLLRKGLGRGQRVRIHGLPGEFVVLDKMPKRWKNHIDLFMDKDIRGARRFGRRHVKISWTPATPAAPIKKSGTGDRRSRPAALPGKPRT